MTSLENHTSCFNASKLSMIGAFVAFLRSFFVQATLATLDLGSNGMEVTWNISGYVICSVETGKKDNVGGRV